VWDAGSEKRRRRPLLAIAAGVLVVALAAGGIWVWKTKGSGPGPEASGDAAARVVTDFLDAVAAGDATTAMGFLAEKPDSTELLTDDVLAASNAAGGLTNIDVAPGAFTDDTWHVKASFRLGSAGVDQVFEVTQQRGTWAVVTGTATVDLSGGAGTLPLAVNGQALSDSSTAVLFPGSYSITVAGDAAKYIALGTATFQVTSLEAVTPPTISPQLTAEGAAAFRRAVRSAVDACVASPNRESGCNDPVFDIPEVLSNGTVVTEGTVERTLSPELDAALDALEPRLYKTNPGMAFAAAPDGLLHLAITGVLDGVTVQGLIQDGNTGALGFELHTPVVDMTNPALPVTWTGR